jgi:glycosyltransferase involved in cell wall biosynthesis
MKVVHLNTYDISGGAARSAYRLHMALSRAGCDSTMFVSQSSSDDPTVVQSRPPRQNFLSRLHNHVRYRRIDRDFARYGISRPDGYERFSDDRSPHGTDLVNQLPISDVINLHWIAGFVDYRTFFTAIPRVTPIVWTMHDMNAFTGGCHYSMGCSQYIKQCGACPQLGSSSPKDLAYQVWRRKRKTFARIAAKRLHLVSPSRWLAREVKESFLGRAFNVSVIPYGVDVDAFAPRDRQTARSFLGIPQQARVVLFLSDALNNARKGYPLLAQALAGLNNVAEIFLLSLGRGQPAVDTKTPQLHFGYVDNDRVLSFIYSAADVYVIPSLQDNLPNTVLEAMACGTPVIGFDVGGIPDMVRPGSTGLLARRADVNSLRDSISELLQDATRRATMAANCRRIAINEYALEVQARRYTDLYESIVEESSYCESTTRWGERIVQNVPLASIADYLISGEGVVDAISL